MHKAPRTVENDKTRSDFLKLGLVAAVSLAWLIVRTGSKPSRITYPCQKAAIANVHIFLLALLAPLIDVRNVITRSCQVLSFRKAKIVLMLGALLIAFGSITYPSNYSLTSNSQSAVPLNLSPQSASTSPESSDLFFVTNALDAEGNMDAAVTNLFQIMDSKGLFLFNTASQPSGLIARDDVVVIKVNCQWPSRGGTNTDLIKSLIKKLLAHPETWAI